MSEIQENPRKELVRKAAILQFKLLVDGIRDAALIPLSLVATIIGLVRGGNDADREFKQVIKLGRRSERWINLFGHQPPIRANRPGGSLDNLLDRVEEVVMDQYREGQSAAEARTAIKKAMQESAPETQDSGKQDS